MGNHSRRDSSSRRPRKKSRNPSANTKLTSPDPSAKSVVGPPDSEKPVRERLTRKRIALLVGLIVILAACLGETVYASILYFGDWSEAPDSSVNSIGLIAANGSDLSQAYLMQSDPSLDLVPIIDGDHAGDLYGVFRVNAPITPQSGANTLGVILPKDALVMPMGADGNVRVITAVEGDYHGRGFSCTSSGASDMPNNPGTTDHFFSISDTAGNFYKIECRGDYTVVWVTLLPGRTGDGTVPVNGTQTLGTKTAAHVVFGIPHYPGLKRTSYYGWRFNFLLSTAPDLAGSKSIADALGSKFAPNGALTVGRSDQEYGYASPAGYSLEHRIYAMPLQAKTCISCIGPSLIDQGPALTWKGLFDNSAHEISVEITSRSQKLWFTIVTGAPVLFAGIIVPTPWGLWRRFRSSGGPHVEEDRVRPTLESKVTPGQGLPWRRGRR